jgi:hypothetical protein
MQEEELGRSWLEDGPGKSTKTLSKNTNCKAKWSWGVVEVVECFPSKGKAPSSNLSAEREREREREG